MLGHETDANVHLGAGSRESPFAGIGSVRFRRSSWVLSGPD